MKTSNNGLNLIKEFEGFRAQAYNLGDGGWTIGYGSFNVPGVHAGTVWTKAQATAQLKKDVVRFENSVNRIGAPLNQNQFDALVSFTYNLGAGWITQYPTMPNALRKKNWKYVTDSMKNFVNPGSPYEAGLRRRRAAEVKLFNTPAGKATTPDKNPDPTPIPRMTAIEKFKAAGNQFTIYTPVYVDEVKTVNGIFQFVNYQLAGSKTVNWTLNGIPGAIVDQVDKSGKKTTAQNLPKGSYAKFTPAYNHGTIDAYDVKSNGVGIKMGKYGMIWFDANVLWAL